MQRPTQGKKFSHQFLIWLTIPILFFSAVLVGSAIANLYLSIEGWIEPIQGFSLTREQQKHQQIAFQQQERIDEYFRRVSSDLRQISSYTTQILDGTLVQDKFYPSFYTIGSTPPGGLNSQGQNFDYSTWFNLFTTDPNQFDLRESAALDNSWRAIRANNPDYLAMYMGRESGLFRQYPFSNLDNFPTLSYVCVTNQAPMIGYDPRCRGWYQTAKLGGMTEVSFTPPYTDATTGDILISVSTPTYQGTFRGALGLDLNMQNLATPILNTEVSPNGYLWLMDGDGNLILYPELDYSSPRTIFQEEFTNDAERDAFEVLFEDQIKGQVLGQFSYFKGGEEWLLSFSRAEVVDYVMVVVAPKSDLLASSDQIEEDTQKSLLMIVLVLLGIFILCAITGTLKTLSFGKQKTDEIMEMIAFFKRATDRDGDVEMGMVKPTFQEAGHLNVTFQRLALAVRYALKYYDQANFLAALHNLFAVEKMLQAIDNQRGLGVVHNNIGNTYKHAGEKVKDHLTKAEKYLQMAVDNAEARIKELTEASHEVQEPKRRAEILREQQAFLVVLANRWMNLALVYQETGEGGLEDTILTFQKAIDVHKKAENYLGIVMTRGNLGLYYLKMHRPDDASQILEQNLSETIQLMNQLGNQMASMDNRTDQYQKLYYRYWKVVTQVQYASSYMAVCFNYQGQYQEAANHAAYTLRLTSSLPKKLYYGTLNSLKEALEKMGHPRAYWVASLLREAKDLALGIDISVSMGCDMIVTDLHGNQMIDPRTHRPVRKSLLLQCQESAKMLLTNFVGVQDQVSLFSFDSTVHPIQEMLVPATPETVQMLMQQIDGLEVGGGTAFFNAIHLALDRTTPIAGRHQFLVFLTDGEDLHSKDSPPYATPETLIKRLKGEKQGIHLMIIAVGNLGDYVKILETLTSVTKESLLLPVNPSSGLNGIEKAFQDVGTFMNNMTQEVLEVL